MGHGHSHRAGLVMLWPDSDRADDLRGSVSFAGEGVTFPEATVEEVAPACASLTEPRDGCGTVTVTVAEGADQGTEAEVEVPPQVTAAGLQAGDRVELIRTPAAETATAGSSWGTRSSWLQSPA